MSGTVGAFVWYELLARDADAAQAFYADVVGWNITDGAIPDRDYRMCNTRRGGVGGIMQLTNGMLAGGAQPAWLGYISVTDVDEAIRRITAAGGNVLVPPSTIPQVGTWAKIADPQGVPFYVIALQDDYATAFDADTDGHCAWNELASPDQASAEKFYADLFGWQRGETMDMGDAGSYQIFNLDDRPIGGMMAAASSPPMWRFYFRVPRLDAALERIRIDGGTLIHGPQPVPGDDEIAIAVDPQGATFALVARRAGQDA